MKKQPIVFAEIFIVLTLMFLILTFVGFGMESVPDEGFEIPKNEIIIVRQPSSVLLTPELEKVKVNYPNSTLLQPETTVHSLEVGGSVYLNSTDKRAMCVNLSRNLREYSDQIVRNHIIGITKKLIDPDSRDINVPSGLPYVGSGLHRKNHCPKTPGKSVRYITKNFKEFSEDIKNQGVIAKLVFSDPNSLNIELHRTPSSINDIKVSIWMCPYLLENELNTKNLRFPLTITRMETASGLIQSSTHSFESITPSVKSYKGVQESIHYLTEDCDMPLVLKRIAVEMKGRSK